MFGKLKDKLKSALSIFSKKAEEEAEEKKVEVLVEEKPIEVRKPVEEKKVEEKKELKEKRSEQKEEYKIRAAEKSLSKKKKTPPKEEPAKEEKLTLVKKEESKTEKIEPEIVKPVEQSREETEITIKPTIRELPKEEKKSFFSFFKKKEEPPIVKKEEVKEEVKPEEKKEEFVERAEAKEETPEVKPEETKGFFGKIKQSFITKTISADKFEELFWELEVALLENNVSVEVIEKIKEDLKNELVEKPLPRDVASVIENTLRKTLREILSVEKIDLLSLAKKKKPFIIAFFGINGSGKTTSIAKLTKYFQKNNFSVVLAACDTFRAAAIQQLEEHADKLGVKMIKHDYGSDAAAVAYDAVKYAEKNKIDIVLIDTAGRLHSNTNLMAELEKIIRVTKPDFKIFVGESITGNDCIEQAKQFNSLVEMDGVILTKADVDEKGGAPLSIAYTIHKPILFMGVGQEYQDLEKFDAEVIMKRLGL